MVSSGFRRRVLVSFGFSRRVMVSSGFRRRVLVSSGFRRRVMVSSGFRRRVMVSSGIQCRRRGRVTMEYHSGGGRCLGRIPFRKRVRVYIVQCTYIILEEGEGVLLEYNA
jgi:hypothetical protein